MSRLHQLGGLLAHNRFLSAVAFTAILAHLSLFLNLPLWIQSWAALLLTAWLPATLLLSLLLPVPNRDPVSLAEHTLYIIGTGYGICVVVMLGLSYLPGSIPQWLAFVTFDLLLFLLLALVRFRNSAASPATVIVSPNPPLAISQPTRARRLWIVAGIFLLALVGGVLRFPDLGYAEFQGDEARAMLRAAEVIEGFDGSLFEHRKGPTEILLPAAPYVLIGRIDEAAARLPFAFANFCGLFALFLLGWRWFGALAGWVAAMLLALDGYLIAFSRIVQYQSIVFLMVVLVLLILQRLVLDAKCSRESASVSGTTGLRLGYSRNALLTLASFLLATGLLSHYEAILVAVPALFLLWQLWRSGVGLGRIAVALVPAILVGGAVLAAFYVPFVRYPTFGNTFEYLAYKRIGEEFTYNNLADYFIRSTLYSSTYAFGLMTLLAVGGLVVRYRRGLGRSGWVVGGLVALGIAACFWSPTWLTVAGTDFTWLFFVAALGLGILMPDRNRGTAENIPGTSDGPSDPPPQSLARPQHAFAHPILRHPSDERIAWIWFAGVMVLSIFFTATPNTHVYNFYFGWALVCGLVVAQGWRWLTHQRWSLVRWAALPVAAALVLVFGYYEYSLFIRNDVEVLRTWPEHRPRGYWTAYEMPIDSSIFGFPHRNGWKSVSVLAAAGVIDGAFDTNTKDWIVDWYTRGLGSCPRDHRYFVLADKVEPTEEPARAALQAELAESHELLAVVHVHDQERLRIYEQIPAGTVLALPEVQQLESTEQAAVYDRTLSQPHLAQSGRVVTPLMERPLNFRLGDQIALVGYTLHNQEVAPGGEVMVTLYWHALAPIAERYTIFVQLINPQDTRKAGQRDGEPVCGKLPTVDWRQGEIIADRYHVPVDPTAPYGTYGLLIGMYRTDGGGDNLPFYNGEGQMLGGSLSIDEIYIQPAAEQRANLQQPQQNEIP